MKTFLITITAIAALMAGSLVAQETTDDAEGAAQDGAQMESQEGMTEDAGAAEGDMAAAAPPATMEEYTVAEFTGLPVMGAGGDRIGEIDYVVDQPDGPVAVIGIGGFLGLGEYTVALPLSDFSLLSEEQALSVGRSEEELRDTPEFDSSDVEEMPGETMIGDLMADAGGAAGEEDAGGDTGGGADAGTGDTSIGDDGSDAGGEAGTGGGAGGGDDAGAEASGQDPEGATEGETDAEAEDGAAEDGGDEAAEGEDGGSEEDAGGDTETDN